MPGHQVDWIGAVGAGISAVIAFAIARHMVKGPGGAAFYVVAGVLTVLLSLALRSVLRYRGV
jgi:hypothetical protein